MKVAIPTTPEELAEAISDPKRLTELQSEPGAFSEFLGNYAKEFYFRDQGSVDAQMEERMKVVLAEMLEENEVKSNDSVTRLPMTDAAANGGTNGRGADLSIYKNLGLDRHQMRQIGATGTGPGMDVTGFKDFAEFAQAISPHVTPGATIDMARMKVLNESQGDQGGFLVPEEFRAELMRIALETAVVRPRANVLPMGGLTMRIPTIRDATHASNVHGGVTGSWTPESGSVSQTEPTFAQVSLTAKKLMGGTRISNEMLRDSAITMEPLINELFGSALAWFEDLAFIEGVGGGQPLGLLNADALISVAKETGQAAATLVVENVIKMFSRLMPESMNTAVWLMNNDVMPQLYTMSLSVGTGGAPMFFPAGGISGGPAATLLGRPIIFTEKCKTLGTAGDIYLVDLSKYLIGDRQALEMASSAHVRFNSDETDFRYIQRLDGRPWTDTALTPRNSTATLSPYVALATRS